MNLFKPTEDDFNFTRIALTASMFMLIDGVLVGGPGIGFLVSSFAVMMYLGFGIWFYFRDKKISGLYLKKAGIYLIAFFGIVVMYKTNSYLGKMNAKSVVEAVKQYQAKNNRYPESLQELVPTYLESIPRCAYRVNTCTFRYYYNEGIHILLWEEAPPFGRRIYNFTNDEWGYLD